MTLADSEENRREQQRRQGDAYLAIKSAEVQQRNSTLAVSATVVGLVFTGAWWLSSQAAKDEVAPLRDRFGAVHSRVSVMESRQDMLEKKITGMETKIDKVIDILMNGK